MQKKSKTLKYQWNQNWKGIQGFGLPWMPKVDNTWTTMLKSHHFSILKMLPQYQRVNELKFNIIYMTLNQSFMIFYIFQHANNPKGISTTDQWKEEWKFCWIHQWQIRSWCLKLKCFNLIGTLAPNSITSILWRPHN